MCFTVSLQGHIRVSTSSACASANIHFSGSPGAYISVQSPPIYVFWSCSKNLAQTLCKIELRFRDASEFKLSCATCENSCSRITWNINLSQCSLHLYMCSEALSELAWRERSERMIAQFRSKDNSGFQLRLRVQAKTVECILQDHLKRKSQSMFPLSVCSEALSELAWHKQCERIILRLRQWNSFSRITWSRTLIQWQNQKELARRNAVKS